MLWVVLEAVELDDIDPEAVKQGLAQYTAAYAAATEDYAKTEAEIGVEVYQAMSFAIANSLRRLSFCKQQRFRSRSKSLRRRTTT